MPINKHNIAGRDDVLLSILHVVEKGEPKSLLSFACGHMQVENFPVRRASELIRNMGFWVPCSQCAEIPPAPAGAGYAVTRTKVAEPPAKKRGKGKA